MSLTFGRVLLWSPRILGIVVSLFIALFALDAFGEGRAFRQELIDFAVHLIPACALLALVAASFRWEWIGGVGFVGLAIWYAVAMSNRRLDWILVISGPLAAVGALFLWSWFHQRGLHAHHQRDA